MDELRKLPGYTYGHDYALSGAIHASEVLAIELRVLHTYPRGFGGNAYWLGRVEGLQEVLAERKASKR